MFLGRKGAGARAYRARPSRPFLHSPDPARLSVSRDSLRLRTRVESSGFTLKGPHCAQEKETGGQSAQPARAVMKGAVSRGMHCELHHSGLRCALNKELSLIHI